MKIKTSELAGAALDWAVAKCEGLTGFYYNVFDGAVVSGDEIPYCPSTDWSQGGPIIEREKLGIVTSTYDVNVWVGSLYEPEWRFNCAGPTPLIAAMRCYVASKLGDEVDVPEELL